MIPIIAILHPLDLAVTTASRGTVIAAIILIDVVAIITALTGADHTVATAGVLTGDSAGVGVNLVAIIAFFIILITGLEIIAQDPVTTTRGLAVIATGIGVQLVAIVTGLGQCENAVAATPVRTLVRAHI